ncbi:MAG: DUF4062 domain-containing protein [Treponema sp.]|jgi:hypothetical protein|nr:DUF4062 domain-containing protein [Treponema sp.]
MIKKYHIFLSSTVDDLKNERQELEGIIWNMGHIPIAMKNFNIKDKDEQRLVKKNIEECDYFLALTAHKYGAEKRPSPPEAEFNHAVKAGIPVIALIIDEKARWKASKKEKDASLVKALEEFKDKLRNYPYDTWSTTAELRQKAQTLLIEEFNLNSQPGWIRSNQAIQPAVANELARLSGENEDLKRQLQLKRGNSRDVLIRLKAHTRRALKILSLNKISLSFYYTSGENWENTREYRYLHLFRLLAPELSLGKTTAELSRFLGNILNPDLNKTVRKDYPAPSNTIKKIMADFSLLKLVKTAENRTDTGDDEAWEITEYGKDLYAAYRMHQLERAAKKNS